MSYNCNCFERMNRGELRDYFKLKNLAYEKIKIGDLRVLESLCNEEMAKQRTERMMNNEPTYWISINNAKYYKGKYNEDGSMVCAFLTAKGGYFSAREVISFNQSGWIGFCGAADNSNFEVVKTAFIRWCDYLEQKERD